MTEVIHPKKKSKTQVEWEVGERISCFTRIFDFPGNKEDCQHRASAQKVLY